MKIRYAILSAVSTAEQARGASLDDQVSACRAVNSKGWVESAGPYIVHGQSRSKYLNLRDAEAEIPAIREALDAAHRGMFDALVVYDHDRLRNLLMLIHHALNDYGVQLYSLSQPIEPQDPSRFDPYENDANVMMLGLSDIRSQTEISRMRRKYRQGMRDRVTLYGLPIRLPFGYRKPTGEQYNRKAIPEPIPSIVQHIVKLKDFYLSGKSLRECVAYLNENKIPPPRGGKWYHQTVHEILKNKFYAGFVEFEKSKSIRDRRDNTARRDRHIPAERIISGAGKHQPLWDESTHEAILAEIKRRTKSFRGRQNNQFTGLLKCGKCGEPMWRFKNGPRSVEDRLIWRCSADHAHPSITQADAVRWIGNELRASLAPYLKTQEDTTAQALKLRRKSTDQRGDIKAQLDRLEDAYLRGLFDVETFARRKADLEKRLGATVADAERAEREAETRAASIRAIRAALGAHTDQIPAWIEHNDPSNTNRVLHLLMESIAITPQGVKLNYKK